MTLNTAAASYVRKPSQIVTAIAALMMLTTIAQPQTSVSSPASKAGVANYNTSPNTGAAKSSAAAYRRSKGNDSWQPLLPLFVPAATYDAGPGVASFTAVADLNHDGRLDVVAADSSGVGVFLGNGDGTLRPVVSYDTGGDGGYSPISVTVADVNLDGKPDLLVVNGGGGDVGTTIALLLGNGDGTFQPYVIAVMLNQGICGPQQVVVADVNRDGKPDLVVSNYCSSDGSSQGEVSILLGKGDGTFEPAVAYDSGGYDTDSVAVADVNGDGKLDLIVTSACDKSGDSCVLPGLGEGTVGVLLGNGDGTFQTAVMYDALAADAGSVAVADLNGDGKPDLVVASCLHNGADDCYFGGVSIFLGNGDGTFQPAVTYIANAAGFTPRALAVGDLDGDGKLDIALSGLILQGNGDGTFQQAQTTGSSGVGVTIGDMNGDGLPDLVDVAICSPTCGNSVAEVILHVGAKPAPVTLTSTPNPSVYAQATFTATVSGGSGTPTGSVILYNQAEESAVGYGNGSLVNGTATFNSYSVDVGTSPIFAAYQGSVTYHPGFSSIVNQVVTPASTTTSIASSANPGPVDKKIGYTVTVTSQYGGDGWVGKVTCLDNGSKMSPSKKNASVYQEKYTTPGTHTIACTFPGDADHLSSNATLTEQIFYFTTTKLKTSGSPSQVGQPVTYTATVSSSFGTVPDGEIVTFTYGSKVLGTAPTSGGIAALTTAALPEGKRTVKATYPGDTSFKTSSGNVKQVVEN